MALNHYPLYFPTSYSLSFSLQIAVERATWTAEKEGLLALKHALERQVGHLQRSQVIQRPPLPPTKTTTPTPTSVGGPLASLQGRQGLLSRTASIDSTTSTATSASLVVISDVQQEEHATNEPVNNDLIPTPNPTPTLTTRPVRARRPGQPVRLGRVPLQLRRSRRGVDFPAAVRGLGRSPPPGGSRRQGRPGGRSG